MEFGWVSLETVLPTCHPSPLGLHLRFRTRTKPQSSVLRCLARPRLINADFLHDARARGAGFINGMALKWKAQRSRRLKWKTHGFCVKMRIEQPKNAKKSCSHAVQETTSLFALLWRARMARHVHAASHVPSDTAGEHDTPTPTPVLVRPRGRAPTSESGVREHTPHFRCSSRTTRTRTKVKDAKMTTKAAVFGRIRLNKE